MRSFFVASLAASLVAAPIAAVASTPAGPAAPLSLQNARAGAEMQDAQALEGTMLWIAIGVVAAAIILILVLDDDDDPDSP